MGRGQTSVKETYYSVKRDLRADNNAKKNDRKESLNPKSLNEA